MQEEVENRSVNLAITTTKLSIRVILAGIRMYLEHRRRKQLEIYEDTPQGKQSVKELIGQDQGATSMEIGDKHIKSFERITRKYGVDFAITKDKSKLPHKYVVFFKARDADALKQVMIEYAKKELKNQKRPSVLAQLNKFKEVVKSLPKKVRHKEKEHIR